MDYRVVITINVTEPQLEKCWTQQWWNSVETSRNNLSGESVSWWYATLQISVRDSQVPQPTLWSQVKSVGESDYVRDCHSKTYCQFNTGPVPAVVSSTKRFSLSLQRGFFELHQWSWCIIFWSEMSGFIWVGQCALGLPGNQPTIRDPNSIPPSSTSSSVSCTSFQMYLCAHMWYLSYKCFHASTTMWSQLSIINQALFA